MKTRSMAVRSGVVASLVMCAGTAWADDVAPPWWRAFELSVLAEWEFATPPADWNFIAPDQLAYYNGSNNEQFYEEFMTHAEVDVASNWVWHPAGGDGEITPAVGTGAASIGFKIQNWIDFMPTKWLRLQVTWNGSVAPTTLLGQGWIGDKSYGFKLEQRIVVDANHYYEDWSVQPNPNWELFALMVPEGTAIDEVVIDTWSFLPSPAGSMLLCVAGAFALGRRRR